MEDVDKLFLSENLNILVVGFNAMIATQTSWLPIRNSLYNYVYTYYLLTGLRGRFCSLNDMHGAILQNNENTKRDGLLSYEQKPISKTMFNLCYNSQKICDCERGRYRVKAKSESIINVTWDWDSDIISMQEILDNHFSGRFMDHGGVCDHCKCHIFFLNEITSIPHVLTIYLNISDTEIYDEYFHTTIHEDVSLKFGDDVYSKYRLCGIIYLKDGHFTSRFQHCNKYYNYDGMRHTNRVLHKSKCTEIPSLIFDKNNRAGYKILYLMYTILEN
jgi:hypothetical protein